MAFTDAAKYRKTSAQLSFRNQKDRPRKKPHLNFFSGVKMSKAPWFVLAVGLVFVSSVAFSQTLECSSANLLEELQRNLRHVFAPPAIRSIEAIASGQSTPVARVEITNVETLSDSNNIQKCSVTAHVWRSDLSEPINAIVKYTIYNRSMMGGFDVRESR